MDDVAVSQADRPDPEVTRMSPTIRSLVIQAADEGAKTGCLVSQALAAVPITLTATLQS
jgi:hypothetical protein